ncbi:hypothetical protein [La Joya virus]|uniref:Uncharacterized protein n=1 Tax=La Joya virus TaxID=1272946 RepID=A0A0D3R0X8_9RHAB|nr:hypothetical protein [La Joya virus]AJR28309.1 hypothetical protein [La Joya virus]
MKIVCSLHQWSVMLMSYLPLSLIYPIQGTPIIFRFLRVILGNLMILITISLSNLTAHYATMVVVDLEHI